MDNYKELHYNYSSQTSLMEGGDNDVSATNEKLIADDKKQSDGLVLEAKELEDTEN